MLLAVTHLTSVPNLLENLAKVVNLTKNDKMSIDGNLLSNECFLINSFYLKLRFSIISYPELTLFLEIVS